MSELGSLPRLLGALEALPSSSAMLGAPLSHSHRMLPTGAPAGGRGWAGVETCPRGICPLCSRFPRGPTQPLLLLLRSHAWSPLTAREAGNQRSIFSSYRPLAGLRVLWVGKVKNGCWAGDHGCPPHLRRPWSTEDGGGDHAMKSAHGRPPELLPKDALTLPLQDRQKLLRELRARTADTRATVCATGVP